MPPEALVASRRRWPQVTVPLAWRRPTALLAAAWVGLIPLFLDDWRAMAAQWWNTSTYNHVLLIPAILAWLVTLRRAELAKLVPGGWWPGLVVVGGAALLWVLGSFAGLTLARQVGAVALLQGAVLAVLGPRVALGLAFPLGYMLFLVPFGDELVPLLQAITAQITMALLALSGIPAVLEGVLITTPTGLFKVAEACSGVKFLIAMSAFAVLTANLCFRSWPRRALFVVATLALAVLANGVRAWGTVMIAHYHGIEFASGFDHVFYGWIFFALVIAVVLGLGWRWFDRSPDDPQIDAGAIAASAWLATAARRRIGEGAALGLILALALGALGWSAAADRLAAPLPARVDLPAVPGWQQVDYAPRVWWQPRHAGADHRLLGRYADAAGNTVDVSYALYAIQGEGREAGGFGEGALTPESAWDWNAAGPPLAAGKTEWLTAAGSLRRLCATWYKTGSVVTGSNTWLKLANIADRLLLRRRTTAVLILSAEERTGQPAAPALARFVAATGDPGRWMDRVAATR